MMTQHRTQTTNVRLKVKCAIHLTIAALIPSDLNYLDLDYPDLDYLDFLIIWTCFSGPILFMNINKMVA